jgi:hypothetical protein
MKRLLILGGIACFAAVATGSLSPVQAQVRHSPQAQAEYHRQQLLQRQLYHQMLLQQKLQQQWLRQQRLQQQRLQQQWLRNQLIYQQRLLALRMQQQRGQVIIAPAAAAAVPAQSVWVGSEDLPGFGPLQFVLRSNGQVAMMDAKETVTGSFVQQGPNISLTFPGRAVYTGVISGATMSGVARDNGRFWNWAVMIPGIEMAEAP